MAKKYFKERKKPLGLKELIAIALGGMIGGGIFSILGISVERIGNATPVAIAIGGIFAFFAAYSYVQLAVYYKDEGATYSFYKRTFSKSHFSAAAIGWFIIFGYISTLALYSFTFASYLSSMLPFENYYFTVRIIAGCILLFFTVVNLISVKGMGKLEDIMVYAKLVILVVISVLLANKGDINNITPLFNEEVSIHAILIISAITFVAFEGFQLVINATEEMEKPEKDIPKAIYSSLGIATFIYIVIAVAALLAIPKAQLIAGKEYALADGAGDIIGYAGLLVVIFGALLATSSAINGTIFGASRQMAVIADDGYMPKFISTRIKKHIPKYAILVMFILAYALVLSGGLELLLKFGSITFLLVSFLMSYANFKICSKTKSSKFMTLMAMFVLAAGCGLILYYEVTTDIPGLGLIIMTYIILTFGALVYSKIRERRSFFHFLK